MIRDRENALASKDAELKVSLHEPSLHEAIFSGGSRIVLRGVLFLAPKSDDFFLVVTPSGQVRFLT